MSDRPLRILHLTAGSDAGGLSRYVLDLSTAMTRAGHRVAVAGDRGAWHDLFAAAAFPWIDAPLKGHPGQLVRAAVSLSRWIDENPIDVLHVHYRRCALAGRLIQLRHRVPMLYTLHLSDLNLRWPRRWLSDFGDHTHAASVDARQWLIDVAGVKPGRITVIPHGVDVSHFRPPTGTERNTARAAFDLHGGDTVAAYVGRLDDPKNEGWLLDLMDQTRASLPNLKLLIAGDGPHRSAVETGVNRAGPGRIKMLGQHDPVAVYHAADALLLPSGREGFSLACAEAMACGVPVLRTRTAGTTEMVIEGVTGRSTPVHKSSFLSAATQFLSDLSKLAGMRTAAADHVRSTLSFERQLAATVTLYRRLCDQPGKREKATDSTSI